MKKNILSIVVILLIGNVSFPQSLISDKFESEISDCFYKKYDSLGIDLKSELLLFEKYLIGTNQLKDNSGESYIEIFKEVVKINNIPLLIDLNKCGIKKNTPKNFHLFSECFRSKMNDENLKNSESKLKGIYNVIKQSPKNTENVLSNFAKGILNVLDKNDFEKEFYRIWALNTFYFTADVTN